MVMLPPLFSLTLTSGVDPQIRYVPASGLSGENVSKRDPDGALSSWYDGPTLLQAIDAFSPAPKATDKPFRMCVADVSSAGKVRRAVAKAKLTNESRKIEGHRYKSDSDLITCVGDFLS